MASTLLTLTDVGVTPNRRLDLVYPAWTIVGTYSVSGGARIREVPTTAGGTFLQRVGDLPTRHTFTLRYSPMSRPVPSRGSLEFWDRELGRIKPFVGRRVLYQWGENILGNNWLVQQANPIYNDFFYTPDTATRGGMTPKSVDVQFVLVHDNPPAQIQLSVPPLIEPEF